MYVEFRLADVKWDDVAPYYLLTIFILISVFAKLLFQSFSWISSRVPESCVLIILGLLFGLILTNVEIPGANFPRFSPNLFFYILLPPIILESAFSLHNKVFFQNIAAVLLYAVVGTAVNFLLIGVFLILIQMLRHQIWPVEDVTCEPTQTQIFLFASLISAVGKRWQFNKKPFYFYIH